MTHKQMLEDSTLIEKSAYPNYRFGIPSRKRRGRIIIILVLTTLYSFFIKFIYRNPAETFWVNLFDTTNPINMFSSIVLIASAIHLVVAFIFKMMASSQAYLNHMKLYTIVRFIMSLCKVVIFASAANTFLIYFSAHFEITSDWFTRYVLGVFPNVLLAKGEFDPELTIKVISFAISVFSFIPAFFFLLIRHIVILFKLLPPFCIYFYVKWLLICPKTFEHYVPYPENPELTIVEYRELNHPYKLTFIEILKKLAITAVIGFILFGIVYPVYLNILFSQKH